MHSPLQAQESSLITPKRIAVVIAFLMVCGFGLWAGLDMALRLTSGHS
jgi:hypothetical protein